MATRTRTRQRATTPQETPATPVPRLRVHQAHVPTGEYARPGFRYSLRLLLQTAQWARQHPDGLIEPYGLWPPQELTGRQWRAWFVGCLMQKITGAPRVPRRKDTPEWWQETVRTARALNTPRLAIHWLPPEWRARFAHRLSERGD